MDQALIEYIKFLSELEKVSFYKNYWIFEWLFFILVILLFIMIIIFSTTYFNVLEEKQRIIELNESVTKTSKINLNYQQQKKKLFFYIIIFSLTATITYLSNDLMKKRLEKEINLVVNANTAILNNRYYKSVIELNEKNKKYKYNLFMLLYKAEEYRNLKDYLSKQYYLNALTKEEYEIINMIEKIN